MIAVVFGFAHLGVDGDTAVVAHTFVCARGEVEEGSLSAVGVADKRHVDDMVQTVGLLFSHEHLVAQCLLVGVLRVDSLRVDDLFAFFLVSVFELFVFLGLVDRNHLNVVGLAVSQRHLVAHDFVLYRVLQWGIEQYVHLLALDESHLDDSFAEATVS